MRAAFGADAIGSAATCSRSQRLAGSWCKRSCQCFLTVNCGTANGHASRCSQFARQDLADLVRQRGHGFSGLDTAAGLADASTKH